MTGLRFGGVIAALVAGLVCVPGALSAPSNDAFAAPTILSGVEGWATATNAEATKEAGEPNHAGNSGGRSVWFSWTAPRSGLLFLDTCDSDFDSLLAVYTGSAVGALTEQASNDDDCAERSALAVDVSGGTEYRIAVDGFDGATGSIVLAFAMAPPNDDFTAAQQLSGEGGYLQGSLAWATHELGEPLHGGEDGTGSIWYSWTAPANFRAAVRGCSPDIVVAVYTGDAVGSLTEAGGTYANSCGPHGSLSFDAFAGTTYRIAVDSATEIDSFELYWYAQPLLPRNTSPPTISGRAATNTTLVASPGTWVYASSFTYYWQACSTVPPTTGSCPLVRLVNDPKPYDEHMTVGSDLLGKYIRVEVTAQGPGGNYFARSATVGPVVPGPPINTLPPDIDGGTIVGETLEATPGEWDLGQATGPRATYLWQRCDVTIQNCRNVKGPGTDSKYRLTSADLGSLIQVVVTMTTSGGSASASAVAQGEVIRPERTARQRRCVVPRLVGKSLKAARKSLAKARCRLGSVRRTRSKRRVGMIVAQRPKPGTRLRVGGRVNVRVSLGRRR
jgi:PASTA domain-containing protein